MGCFKSAPRAVTLTATTSALPTAAVTPLQQLRNVVTTQPQAFQPLSMVNRTVWCYVSKVYDGDTLTLQFLLNGAPYEQSTRLMGLDAPEMKPSLSSPNRNLEMQAAKDVRDLLCGMVLNKYVWAVFYKQADKFGRGLATLYAGDQAGDTCFNEFLVSNGLCKPFTGKVAKQPWTDEELGAIIHTCARLKRE